MLTHEQVCALTLEDLEINLLDQLNSLEDFSEIFAVAKKLYLEVTRRLCEIMDDLTKSTTLAEALIHYASADMILINSLDQQEAAPNSLLEAENYVGFYWDMLNSAKTLFMAFQEMDHRRVLNGLEQLCEHHD